MDDVDGNLSWNSISSSSIAPYPPLSYISQLSTLHLHRFLPRTKRSPGLGSGLGSINVIVWGCPNTHQHELRFCEISAPRCDPPVRCNSCLPCISIVLMTEHRTGENGQVQLSTKFGDAEGENDCRSRTNLQNISVSVVEG